MTGTAIPTDLLTPLAAYLRLRRVAGGSFLLESVERGRLGRNSFVGSGSRLVDLSQAEVTDAPVVGYVAYDHAAVLEATVPLPDEGPPFPESRLVVADMLVRFDHGAGVAEVLAGVADEVARLLDQPSEPVRHADFGAGPIRRFPDRERYEAMVRTCKPLPDRRDDRAHGGRR